MQKLNTIALQTLPDAPLKFPPSQPSHRCQKCRDTGHIWSRRIAAPCDCSTSVPAAGPDVPGYNSCTFDACAITSPPRVDPSEYQSALATAREYSLNPKGLLIIHGFHDTGKTSLAACIARQFADNSVPRAWADTITIAGRDTDPDRLRKAPYLTIDDIPPTANLRPRVIDIILNILEYRRANLLPTTVTLRLPLHQYNGEIRSKLNAATTLIHLPSADESDEASYLRGISDQPWHGEIPAPLLSMTFNTFDDRGAPGATSHQRRSLAIACQSVERWVNAQMPSLSIFGPFGVGKTHLAVAAAQETLLPPRQVFFSTAIDLVNNLRFYSNSRNAQSGSYDAILHQARQAPLLILDDLGDAAQETDFTKKHINGILTHRHTNALKTIITTNITMESLHQANPRLASRISDVNTGYMIHIDAPDYRRPSFLP